MSSNYVVEYAKSGRAMCKGKEGCARYLENVLHLA